MATEATEPPPARRVSVSLQEIAELNLQLELHKLLYPNDGKFGEVEQVERMMRTPVTERGAPECKMIGKWLSRESQLPRIVSTKNMVQLSKHFELYKFEEGEYVFRRGQRGETLFVIYQGTVQMRDGEGGQASTLTDGQVFGEAVLRKGNGKRTESALCCATTKVLGLGLHDFKLIMANHIREEQERTYLFLQRNMPLASDWPEFKLRIFINTTHRQEYTKGDVIWRQGDPSQSIMILIKGGVSLERVITVATHNKWPVPSAARLARTARYSTGNALFAVTASIPQARTGLLLESDADQGAPLPDVTPEAATAAAGPAQPPPPHASSESPEVHERSRQLPELHHKPSSPALASTTEETSTASGSIFSATESSSVVDNKRTRRRKTQSMLVANTPRGLHHCRTTTHTVRHVQRTVQPGELFGEEGLDQPVEYENNDTPPRRYWAVVTSDVAACLVLNKQNARRFFGLHPERCLEGLDCYAVESDEQIMVKRRLDQTAKKLMIDELGPSYLKRSGLGRRWIGTKDM